MFEEIVTKEEIKFNNLEKKIFKFVCSFGCLILKFILEKYDRKLMKERDTKKYRHKGLRKNTIKTIMGEVEYKRAMYEVEEAGIKKRLFLLDEKMHINTEGKISENLIEKIVETVPITDSYRKAETVINETTNASISFEWVRNLTLKVGDKIVQREKEERNLYKKGKLIAGEKEVAALFEEADGLWINLQGKDRNKRLEENKKKAEKENKEINPKMKIKTELKLHVMYEGWKKDDKRHSLVNKQYIAGIMKPKEIKELRDARVYQQYDEEKIKLRATNGDGAPWTRGTTVKGGIYQKDQFHIMQEIVRDVPKEYREEIKELIIKKQYKKIQPRIEKLKYEVGGEEKAVKKLEKLQSYLSSGIERYQDKVELPKAPKGIEYRNMGTQESQIFSKLKKRFCSGRKAFSEHGANALAKICVLREKFKLEDIETEIPIDTSAEEWISKLEENVRKNRRRKDSFLTRETTQQGLGIYNGKIEGEDNIIKEILRYKKINELKLSF